jgi:hypothetical protein
VLAAPALRPAALVTAAVVAGQGVAGWRECDQTGRRRRKEEQALHVAATMDLSPELSLNAVIICNRR